MIGILRVNTQYRFVNNIHLCTFLACHSGTQWPYAAGPVTLLLAPRLAQQQSHQEALSFTGLFGHLHLSAPFVHFTAIFPSPFEKEKTLLSQSFLCKQ